MSDRQRYNPDEIRSGYEQIQTIAYLVAQIDLDLAQAVLESMNFTDAVMPLLDPTGWMRIQRTAPDHRKLASAFVRFRAAIEELKPKE